MEVMAALLGAIVAAFVTYFISNRDLSDSLDSKSEWRKKLFEVASKYELTLDDAQTVRVALRFLPSKEDVEQYSFAWFSTIMIVHLDKYILNEKHRDKVVKQSVSQGNNNSILDSDTKEIVRLFATFLLKYHFENRGAMGPKVYLLTLGRNKNKIYNDVVKEAYEQYMKLMKWGIRKNGG